MKGLVALGIIVIAFLSGLSIVLSAEPLEGPVRILLGLGFAGALAWALRGPLGQALADQLRGSPGGPSADPVLAQLEQMMGELQAVRDDLAVLNDRMDFTERLLTQHQQRARIGPGEEEEL
jgi:hypothetical protein